MSGRISVEAMNSALQYLGKPQLTELDCSALFMFAGESGDDGFAVIEIVNYVVYEQVACLVKLQTESEDKASSEK